jgi:SAM-dependent methyltransferase
LKKFYPALASIRKTHPHAGRKKHPVDAKFWERCYQKGEAFWDHGEPSPGLVDFLAREKYTSGSVLVFGCGRGHDCLELARHGFNVTGMDISRSGIMEAKRLAEAKSQRVRYIIGDCLKLPRRMLGAFDWVFEHTCFCAIDPEFRAQYVGSVVAALKPRGRLLGVFYNIQPKSGPPFGTTRLELVEQFNPQFRLLLETVPRSFPNREGKELLMLWERKS